MAKVNLLDDDGDLGGNMFQVNEEFARRFEHNKRREELHRLQEKHPEVAARLAQKAVAEAARAARGGVAADAGDDYEDEDESSSDDDDEEEEELEENDDTDKVLETLVRIKRQDPALYQPNTVLFPAAEGEEAGTEGDAAGADGSKKGSKSKPMYLRTVLAKQALEGGAASSDNDDNDADDRAGVPRQPVDHSYAAEQQELKKAFLAAAEEAEQSLGQEAETAGLLKKAKKQGGAAAGEANGEAGKEQQVNQLLDEYFGRDDQLDAAGAFLKSYLAKKAWKEPREGPGIAGSGSKKRLRGLGDSDTSSSEDEGDSSGDEGGPAGADDEEDEQFLEQVDRFEAAYNFRYEEPGSHRIQSFPRVIADSVRRPEERRKRQRESKAQRRAAEKEAREAELRRLKNLKKDEIQDMLARIQQEAGMKAAQAEAEAEEAAAAAGGGAGGSAGLQGLLDELLEGEFDPEEYDRRMAAAFDDAYYEEDDERDELFGDAEEELADEVDVEAPADPEAAATAAGGFAALRKKLQQQQQQQQQQGDGGPDELDESEGEEAAGDSDDGDDGTDKAEKAAAVAEQRSRLQRMLEEYYKLDYEDNIGGLACRFRYRQVPAENFGLTDEDILTLSDKQLNQIAGLRLIAPYREDSKKLRPNYKALQSIKGEAAAAAARRQQRKDREKAKEKNKRQNKQQGQGQQQQGLGQLQQGQQEGKAKQQQQQQQGQKRKFEQRNGQQGQQQQRHKQQRPQQHGKQQKPLAEMTAEEKQATRLASYAKLTLKPSKEAQQQAGGSGSTKHKPKKHKTGAGEGGEGQKQQQKPAQPAGRLASVQLEVPLTKAQKKNLLRALKRKEKQQQPQS